MERIFLMFALYSFLGWTAEVVYAYIKENRWVNRGFLYGPFCPIYAFGVLIGAYLLEKFGLIGEAASIVEVFVLVFISASAIELVTGYLLERLFHAKWWDYSHCRFNFKGYICLKFSIAWGAAGVIALKWIHPSVRELIYSLEGIALHLAVAALGSYFIIDGYHTLCGMIDLRNLIIELERITAQVKIELERLADEFGEEIKEKIESVENRFLPLKDALVEKIYKRRLFKAFPEMRSIRYPDLFRPARELYLKRKNGKK